jgi:hypothetical protein
MLPREQWRLRYLEVAIRLGTSEENVRRLYQEGELEAYAGRKIEKQQYREDTLRILLESTPFDRQMVQQAIKSNPDENRFQLRTRLIATRMFFEFFLPPIVGLYAIYELLFGAFVFPPIVAAIATYGLIGLIAGILAKLVMPGDDPGGIIVTVFLGVAGTCGPLRNLGREPVFYSCGDVGLCDVARHLPVARRDTSRARRAVVCR